LSNPNSRQKYFKGKYLHIMGKYFMVVLRYSHQQSGTNVHSKADTILLSTMNTVGICKHITILILYKVNSSHASIQHFFYLCFQLIPLTPHIPLPFLKCVSQFTLFRLPRLKVKTFIMDFC
jgi:hypothetical protein